MNTISRMFASGCLLMLIAVACQKETVRHDKINAVSTPEKGIGACMPYRSLVGYLDMCDELDAETNCPSQSCPGLSVIITKDLGNYRLQNSNGSDFVFSSVQTIDAALQTEVMLSGQSVASSHCPAGYFVQNIDYRHAIAVGGSPSYALIYTVVTYQMCATEPGGPKGPK